MNLQFSSPEIQAISTLLPIKSQNIGQAEEQSVNARHLHSTLEVKKDFSTWVKEQIQRAQLEEHLDFEVFPFFGENPSGGRPIIEYALTLDAAKHIAMMSNTVIGKAVRIYFIEVEKQSRCPSPVLTQPSTLSGLALARQQAEQTIQLINAHFEHEKRLEAQGEDIAQLKETHKLIATEQIETKEDVVMIVHRLDHAPIDAIQKRTLYKALQELGKQGHHKYGYANAHTSFQKKFGVRSYDELPQAQYDDAISWVRAKVDHSRHLLKDNDALIN